jgi:hypothetical protein
MKNNYKNRSLIGEVLDLAKRHASEGDMASSAELCYQTACKIMGPAWNNDRADITGADVHALRSLSYSVGVFHTDYKLAEAILAKNQTRCVEEFGTTDKGRGRI